MFNPFGGKKKKGRGDDFGGEGFATGGSRPPERKMVPTDEVRALSSRGVPEPDIIRTLRREGYSTGEIDQAMKDALRSRVSGDFYNRPAVNEYGEAPLGPPPENIPARDDLPRDMGYPISPEDEEDLGPPPFEPQAPPMREPEYPEMPQGDYFQPAPRRMPVSPRAQKGGLDRKEIEELAEVIVDEKLRDVKERFRAVDLQFQQVTRKMDTISEDFNRMRMDRSGEIKGIENKIDSYYKGMEGVNAKIDSMERALRDSLSPMLESLRSLSDLVRSMKEKGK